MGEIPKIYFFFSSRLFLSLRGATDLRGAHQIGLRAGRARPLYRLMLARSPFPLSPFLVLPPSRPHLSSLPLAHLFHLSTPPEGPRPTADDPRRGRRSARAVPRPPCLRDLRPLERLPAPPGRFASPILFLFRGSLADRWRAAGCCPAHAASTYPQGLGALALPNPVPPPLGNRES